MGGLVAYPLTLKVVHRLQNFVIVAGDDTRIAPWDTRFQELLMPSSFDSSTQKAYVCFSKKSTPQPLVISLHSWSGDYRQNDPLAKLIADNEWHYVHPDFRGPNNNPLACVSQAVLRDIDDAIAFAISNANVDQENIFVVGGSGGGLACCAFALSSRHPVRSYIAWVPITDLAAWYHQCKNRNLKYAADIESVFKNSTDFYKSASERSPMTMPIKNRNMRLHIFAGIRDGYDGSVPISHSLLFFNRLCDAFEDSDSAINCSDITSLLSRDTRDSGRKIGDRDVFFTRSASFGSVTIFDGAHETLHDHSFKLFLEESAK
jgi:pimeloyl-ACP methyl ester carboxylesterase